MTANTVSVGSPISTIAGINFARLTSSITDRIVAGTPGIKVTKEMVIDYVEHRDFAEMVKDLTGIDLYSLWSDTGEKAEMISIRSSDPSGIINLIHDSFLDHLHTELSSSGDYLR